MAERWAVRIRTYQPGDEVAQAALFNEAAAGLPKFKPATADEVGRRCGEANFDPTTRHFAEEAGRPIGYVTFHVNGRVSYPWCRPGQEAAGEPLFAAATDAMRQRGLHRAFAAYRTDWPIQQIFFVKRDFRPAREMVNFVQTTSRLPMKPGPESVSPLRRDDVDAVWELAPGALRSANPRELAGHVFENPYFGADAAFAIRGGDGRSRAVGLLVLNPAYANPRAVDAGMPCFRLGAFGTEGMQTKRLQGLFSFLAPAGSEAAELSRTLLDHAAGRLRVAGIEEVGAQVASDVPHLMNFYTQHFEWQGSFPVLERPL